MPRWLFVARPDQAIAGCEVGDAGDRAAANFDADADRHAVVAIATPDRTARQDLASQVVARDRQARS